MNDNLVEGKPNGATICITDGAFGNAFSEFCEQSADCTADLETIYALPEKLITGIESALGGWLTPRELEFENQLLKLCRRFKCIGIVCGRPAIHYFRFEDFSPISKKLFEELGWGAFWTYERASELLRVGEDRIESIHDELESYLGWLITEPSFLAEVESLRSRENIEVSTHGTIESKSELASDYAASCRKWRLAGMTSWELPLPQGPNLTGLQICRNDGADFEELVYSFPATMGITARFPLRQIIAEIRSTSTPSHLQEWDDVLNGSDDKGKGKARYRDIFRLHFYRDKVLASRYCARMKGNTERLDRAFAEYLGTSEDSIKKMRLAIKGRLNRKLRE